MNYHLRYLSILFLLFVACSPTKQPSLYIEGDLGSSNIEYIIWSTFNSKNDTIKLNGRKTLSIAPRRYKTQYIDLQISKKIYEIYVGPKLNLEFEIQWEGKNPTVVFGGNAAGVNRFLQEKKELEQHETLSKNYLARYSPDEFDEASLRVYNLLGKKLADIKSDKFYSFYQNQHFALDCWHSAQKLNYLTQNFPTTPSKHWDIKIAKALIGASGYFIEIREYRELVNAYLMFEKNQAIKTNALIGNFAMNKLQMETIGNLKMNGESKNYFLEKLLSSIWISNPEEAEFAIQFYKKHCTKEHVLDKLYEKTSKLTALQESSSAPEFLARNINNDFVALSDFIGRYVYIFFWSEDSAPCEAEFKDWNKLVSRYSGRNISFLTYSFNSNNYRWQKALIINQLKGTHIHGDHKISKVILDKYQVYTTPRFILIDPNGKLLSPFAFKPSENITTVLDDLLIYR